MLDFVRWYSEATKVWISCNPPENDDKILILSSSTSLGVKHILTFAKSSVRDSWQHDITEAINNWKESAKFRYSKTIQHLFDVEKLLHYEFDLKAVGDVDVVFEDEKKKKQQETVKIQNKSKTIFIFHSNFSS